MCVARGRRELRGHPHRQTGTAGIRSDSAIELASALVVLWRFKKISRLNETIASRITGLLLSILAAFVLGSLVLAFTGPRFRPEPSYSRCWNAGD